MTKAIAMFFAGILISWPICVTVLICLGFIPVPNLVALGFLYLTSGFSIKVGAVIGDAALK